MPDEALINVCNIVSEWLYAVWQHSSPFRFPQRRRLGSSPPVTCSSLQKHSKYVAFSANMVSLFYSLQLLSKNNRSFLQTLGMLEAMAGNKQYSELEESVNKAVQFIRYPGHCLRDGPRLLALLANLLYPDLRYLHIIH